MVSYNECSAGGNHVFEDHRDDDLGDTEIVRPFCCNNCEDVVEHEVLIRDSQYEFVNCAQNECKKSDSGHDWDEFPELNYDVLPDVFYLTSCKNCDGERKEWYKHKRTDYIDKSGQTIHSNSV